jgi:hypothetical protein
MCIPKNAEKLLRTAVSRKAAKHAKEDNNRSLRKLQPLNEKILHHVVVFRTVFYVTVLVKFMFSLRLCVFARKWCFIEESLCLV